MKKRLLITMVTFAVGLLSISATAQDKVRLEIGYNISTPMGSFKSDYINNSSFRGVTGELSYPISPKFSLGLHSGYQSYYQRNERQLYKTAENETTSAVVTNTMEVIPFILRGTYYPKGGSTAFVQPYVSAGAGVNLVNYSQYFGQFTDNQASFPLAAQAGAGLLVPLGSKFNQSAFKVGATYNFTAYNKNNISNLSSVGVHAGVIFAMR